MLTRPTEVALWEVDSVALQGRKSPWSVARLLRGFLPPLASAGVVMLVGASWMLVRYESLQHGLARLRGEVLIVDSPHKDVGTFPQSGRATVTFAVKNISTKPICILGAGVTCGCSSPRDFPLKLVPNESRELAFVIQECARPAGETLRWGIRLYVDCEVPNLRVPLEVVAVGGTEALAAGP